MDQCNFEFGNVLSLFDGKSCGQLALERLGVKHGTYFASEVNPASIKVTQHHYPGTVQLGDVRNIKCSDLPGIDLMMGGSPCQGFSMAGNRLNFDDPRSKLFFEFLRLLMEVKPRYWLLENVVMGKDIEETISSLLGVRPVLINSKLVSAQNRERLYWANFKITQPPDKNIKLHDILEDHVVKNIKPGAIRGRDLNKSTILGRRFNHRGVRDDNDLSLPLVQCLEVRGDNSDKSNCITTVDKDNVLTPLPVGRYPDAFKKKLPFRYYTLKELCRLQTLPDDYFNGTGVSETQARKMVGNGWTIDVICHILGVLAGVLPAVEPMPPGWKSKFVRPLK
jgi:DNA (cytosine-5)-methyltransferase 3A